MEIPSFSKLEEQRRGGDRCAHVFAQRVHPNPVFYKYYWWVFHKDSPCDGEEFLSARYRLATAAAAQLMQELEARREPFWLYNDPLPRLDPANTPWDPSSPRWKSIEWALAYAEDPDPEDQRRWRGHK